MANLAADHGNGNGNGNGNSKGNGKGNYRDALALSDYISSKFLSRLNATDSASASNASSASLLCSNTTASGQSSLICNLVYDSDWPSSLLPMDEKTMDKAGVLQATVMLVLFVLMVLINGVALVTIRGTCCFRPIPVVFKRRRASVFLQNLIVSDIIVAFAICLVDGTWQRFTQWHSSDAVCKITKTLQAFAVYLSAYSVTIIAVERVWAMRQPLRLSASPMRSKTYVAAIWVLSLVLSIPQILIFEVNQRGSAAVVLQQCSSYKLNEKMGKSHELFYFVFSYATTFMVPLLTIVGCYSAILCILRSKSSSNSSILLKRDRRGESTDVAVGTCKRPTTESSSSTFRIVNQSTNAFYHRAHAKTFRVACAVCSLFIICWLPYYTLFLAHILSIDVNADIVRWFLCITTLTSIVNPMVYGYYHVEIVGFRRSTKRAEGVVNLHTKDRSDVDNGVMRVPRGTHDSLYSHV